MQRRTEKDAYRLVRDPLFQLFDPVLDDDDAVSRRAVRGEQRRAHEKSIAVRDHRAPGGRRASGMSELRTWVHKATARHEMCSRGDVIGDESTGSRSALQLAIERRALPGPRSPGSVVGMSETALTGVPRFHIRETQTLSLPALSGTRAPILCTTGGGTPLFHQRVSSPTSITFHRPKLRRLRGGEGGRRHRALIGEQSSWHQKVAAVKRGRVGSEPPTWM